MRWELNHIFSGGMYGGKNTLIRASVDRREACSPDVTLLKNLFFNSLKIIIPHPHKKRNPVHTRFENILEAVGRRPRRSGFSERNEFG